MSHSLLFSRYRVILLREWHGWGVNLTVICNWCRVYVWVKLYLGIILWRRTWFLVCGLIFVGLAMTEAVSSMSVTAGHTMWGLWLKKHSGRLGLSPSIWAFLCQYNSTDTPYLSPSLYCLYHKKNGRNLETSNRKKTLFRYPGSNAEKSTAILNSASHGKLTRCLQIQ